MSSPSLAAGVYIGTAVLAGRFAGPSENLTHVIGLFTWIQSSFDPLVMAGFLVRAVLSPLLPLSLLVVVAARGALHRRDSVTLPLLLCISACIWLQPMLGGPDITGGNGPRLLTLGMLPLYVALGLALRDAGLFTTARPARRVHAVVALAALGSLHHWYVLAAAPSQIHKLLFALAYATTWAGCMALTVYEMRMRTTGEEGANLVT